MLSPETPILLLTTGGTIDKVYFDALSDYQVGETVMAKLLQVARVKRPFRIEEITRKDSLELDDTDRALIAARVAAAREKHIVITHGTDTMTETAKLLQDIPGKTVVLVGALAPARFGESDASFNLGMAFATAQVAEPAHRIGGAQLKPDFFPGLATGSVAGFKIARLTAASWKSHLP